MTQEPTGAGVRAPASAGSADLPESRQDGIRWRVADGVGTITLDRPERANAIGLPESVALSRAIHAVLDARPRVVVLQGTGKIFCAGGDIESFIGAGDGIDTLIERILDPLHPAIERLGEAPVPVVSVLNGAIGGAGIGLALCADFVLAAASMKLRTGYAAIGLSPDAGASYFLSRRIGSERAKQLFMLSDPLSAERCLAMGIVDAVHPDGELAAAADALIQRLTACAPGSIKRIKHLCAGASARTLGEHLALERDGLVTASRTGDAREGIRAFVERRAPRFEGG
jgi:2-(1,2-epoxy-1,2-dihydrophenyl)acetyl-CoA isomerase